MCRPIKPSDVTVLQERWTIWSVRNCISSALNSSYLFCFERGLQSVFYKLSGLVRIFGGNSCCVLRMTPRRSLITSGALNQHFDPFRIFSYVILFTRRRLHMNFGQTLFNIVQHLRFTYTYCFGCKKAHPRNTRPIEPVASADAMSGGFISTMLRFQPGKPSLFSQQSCTHVVARKSLWNRNRLAGEIRKGIDLQVFPVNQCTFVTVANVYYFDAGALLVKHYGQRRNNECSLNMIVTKSSAISANEENFSASNRSPFRPSLA